MSDTQARSNPIVVIAAISVIIFSAVGIGVMTGVIPSSFSKNSETQIVNQTDASKEAAAPAKKTANSTPAMHKKLATSESAKRVADQPARVASAPRVCNNCGRVETIRAIEQQGEGSGLGAVAGGVIGGVLGNQVGGGSGRTIATVVGAGAGAFAGNEVEKRVKKTLRYDVVVRLEDGTSRTFSYSTEPSLHSGDKVKIIDGRIVAN